MKCEISWNTLSPAQWENLFARMKQPNLLQSYAYARATCPRQNLRGRWGLITIDGVEAGLVQILEAGLFKNTLHALILDRGPLWLDGFGSLAHIEAFFTSLNATFPRRIGRRRRILPEVPDTTETRALMTKAGLKRLDRPGYQTIWVNLKNSTDDIWQNMNSAWRNSVRKAEKAGLHVHWTPDPKEISALLRIYQSDKATKGYDGPSVALLQSLAKHFLETNNVWAGQVKQEDRIVAAALFFCHGCAATYQIGWSTDEGKKQAAQNLLLWGAMQKLKKNGIRYFDLGGVNDETAQGVKKFKEGTGGTLVTLAGHYT